MTNRILLAVLCSLLCLAGRADDRSKSLVADLARKIASYKSYEVTFTVIDPIE